MAEKKIASLLFRNLLFTILQPGLVTAIIPYFILHNSRYEPVAIPLGWVRYTALALFVTGLAILLDCILRFAIEGRGTLSPADPTKNLVTKGLYRYSRNPMYLGVMLILIGEAIFFGSGPLWSYLVLVFVAFNAFIYMVEEPRLRREFGEDYRSYCNRVRRWL